MTAMSKEAQYNANLSVEDITKIEVYDPTQLTLLTYSKPTDVCNGITLMVANMHSTHFHFECLGRIWKSVEHLYLCGEWSVEGQRAIEIQEDVLTAKSGYVAKRFKKNKYKKEIREDFPHFRHQWMLWCVWQKCLGSESFRNHLTSLPNNQILIEVVKNDPVWAADYEADGNIVGANGMGKILTICRMCLLDGREPEIDKNLLNAANIYILGNKVVF